MIIIEIRFLKKNISFTVLGHEECEVCESLKIHEHTKDNLVEDCEICQIYFVHKKKPMLQELCTKSTQKMNSMQNLFMLQ